MRAPLEQTEKREARRRVAVSAPVVHEAIRLQGKEELERTNSALAWSGFAAGLSMGFSLILEGVIASMLPHEKWAPLLIRLGYPIGFILVIIGRQQLYTENTLTAVIPVMAKRDMRLLFHMLRLWIIVLASNLAGAHLIAFAIAHGGVFGPEIQREFTTLGEEARAVGFGMAILKGIFAGWLIASVVWLLAASQHNKLQIIVILTYVVALSNLTHVIAGSVDVLYLVWIGKATWWSWFSGYLTPAFIGNTLGGVALVSALNHAQVVSGHEDGEGEKDGADREEEFAK